MTTTHLKCSTWETCLLLRMLLLLSFYKQRFRLILGNFFNRIYGINNNVYVIYHCPIFPCAFEIVCLQIYKNTDLHVYECMGNPLLGIDTTTLTQVPQGDDITYFRRRCPTKHFVQNLVTSHVEVRKGIPYRVFNHRECLLYSRETKALDSKDATFVKPLFGNAQVFRTESLFYLVLSFGRMASIDHGADIDSCSVMFGKVSLITSKFNQIDWRQRKLCARVISSNRF